MTKIRVPLYVKKKSNFFGLRTINFQTFFTNSRIRGEFYKTFEKFLVRALSGLKHSAIASCFKSP